VQDEAACMWDVCVLLLKGIILSTCGYMLRYLDMRNGCLVVIILSLSDHHTSNKELLTHMYGEKA